MRVEAPEQRAAVIAERRALVRLSLKLMRDINVEPLLHALVLPAERLGARLCLIGDRASADDVLVALFVKDHAALRSRKTTEKEHG